MDQPLHTALTRSVAELVAEWISLVSYVYDYYQAQVESITGLVELVEQLDQLLRLLRSIYTLLRTRTWFSSEQEILQKIRWATPQTFSTVHHFKNHILVTQEQSLTFAVAESRVGDRPPAYPFWESTLETIKEAIQELSGNLFLVLATIFLKDDKNIPQHVRANERVISIAHAVHVSATFRDSSEDVSKDYIIHSARQFPTTGQAFTRSQVFKNWLQQDNSFLFLRGPSGSGKSTLCSALIRDLVSTETERSSRVIAFFYFNPRNETRQDVRVFLRTLNIQLHKQTCDANSDPWEDTHNDPLSNVGLLLEQLQRLLRRAYQFYILLDGLDSWSSGGAEGDVLRIIREIRQCAPPGLHLLVSSRNELPLWLDTSSCTIFQMSTHSIQQEMQKYVLHRINQGLGMLEVNLTSEAPQKPATVRSSAAKTPEEMLVAESTYVESTPTLSVFRSQIEQLYPNLANHILDRLAQHQLHRYNRLIQIRIQHGEALKTSGVAVNVVDEPKSAPKPHNIDDNEQKPIHRGPSTYQAPPAPPEDAPIGSKYYPWTRLSEYEMYRLRKRVGKDSTREPDDNLLRKQLADGGTGWDNYFKARATAHSTSTPFIDIDDQNAQSTTTARPEILMPGCEDEGSKEVLTAVAFPNGIPLPPTKYLPATFKCPVCFQTKNFKTASSWTLHVYGDLQPFTCTFEDCPEPKPFRLRRRWAHHQIQDHHCRDVWMCSRGSCKQYFDDQQSVISHILSKHPVEAERLRKLRRMRARYADEDLEEDKVHAQMVDFAASWSVNSRSRLCRFCDKICYSWTKLFEHVEKHMEQIATLVLPFVFRHSAAAGNQLASIVMLDRKNDPQNEEPWWEAKRGEAYAGESDAHTISQAKTVPTISVQHASLATDSGYESFLLDTNTDAKHTKTRAMTEIEEEARTVYSDGVSIEPSHRDDLIQRFAELLVRDLQVKFPNCNPTTEQLKNFEDLLADFATRLEYESSLVEIHQAVRFIHKYRKLLCQSSDDEPAEAAPPTGKMPIAELMQMWIDRKDETPIESLADNLGETIYLSDDEAEEDPEVPLAEDYGQLILETQSYRWLLFSMDARTCITSQTDKMNDIQRDLSHHLPKVNDLRRSSNQKSTGAVFHFYCSRADLPDGGIGKVLAITGSSSEAQALKCAAYIAQTWPTNGYYAMNLLEDILGNPGHFRSGQRPDGAILEAIYNDSCITLQVQGTRNMVIEVAQQFCWLCSALNLAPSSSLEGLRSCSASLHFVPPFKDDATESLAPSHKADSVGVDHQHSRFPTFQICLDYMPLVVDEDQGTCWHQLFHHCVVVQGFPIRRRPKAALGLEMPLNVIARLLETEHLEEFRGHVFMKSFSSLLAPAKLEDHALVWHLRRNKTEERVSYLDHGLSILAQIDTDEILDVRHIVGWCTNVENCCGTSYAEYSVSESLLPVPGPNSALSDCLLSFGKQLTMKTDYLLTTNHIPLSLSQRNYLDIFQDLERRLVLLWDTASKRGWLIDGLRALLHLLRRSFEIDREQDAGGLFVLDKDQLVEPKDPFGPRGARAFLHNFKNLTAKVAISGIHRDDVQYENLGDRLLRTYGGLEKAIDYQQMSRSWPHISRNQLEGWDFVSLARRDNIIKPSVLMLPTIARGWVDLIRASGIVTLMGEGFGDLLKPGTGCQTVPCSQYYIAATTSDLGKLSTSNRCRMNLQPRLLCRDPPIMWHNPSSAMSQTCGCQQEPGESKSISTAQVLWPSKKAHLLPMQSDHIDLLAFVDGAVIFGHHESLRHYLPEFGDELILGQPPDPVEELEKFEDSGIGSSMRSNSELERVISADTDLSMGGPPVRVPSNGSHTFRDSYMNGGCGVYGSVAGNFSVNQYFTYQSSAIEPSSSAESSKFQQKIAGQSCAPNQALPAPSHLAPQQQPMLRASSTSSDESMASQHHECTILDKGEGIATTNDDREDEIQQAEMEIKAMGLQDYCGILQL